MGGLVMIRSKIFTKALAKASQLSCLFSESKIGKLISKSRSFKQVVLAIVGLVCFCCFFCSKAFIYDIRVMRKWDEPSKQYSYFIGLGDFHDKSHSITDLQIKQIDALVARCKKERTKLIVEDVCSEPTSGTKLCNKFCINSTGGILGGIANKYKNSGFNNFSGNPTGNPTGNPSNSNLNNLDNIEYRFCRVASLAPVINGLKSDYKNFMSTSKIRIGCFKDEIMNQINEIRGYNDGGALKKWYQVAIDSVINSMACLKFDKCLDTNIADYLNLNSDNKNRLNFVKKLLIFDSCLLDAKIVHSIVGQNCGKSAGFSSAAVNTCVVTGSNTNSPVLNKSLAQNFIVMAGGSHIRNVSSVLESIGYKPVYQSNVIVKKEVATQNCAPSNIMSDGFCCKPEPADLSVLERFI
jgi:hypothetical protein